MSMLLDAALDQLFEPEALRDDSSQSQDLNSKNQSIRRTHGHSSGTSKGRHMDQHTIQSARFSRNPASEKRQRAWELLEKQMEDMQQSMQEMHAKMNRFQCNMTLLKQVALAQDDDKEEESQSLVLDQQEQRPPESLANVSSFQRLQQQPQSVKPIMNCITVEPLEPATSLKTQAPPQQDQVELAQEVPATTQVVAKKLETPEEPRNAADDDPEAPEATTTFSPSARPPSLFASKSLRILPMSPTVEFSRSTRSLTNGPGAVDARRQEQPANPPTKNDLASSRWVAVKDHLSSMRMPATTKPEEASSRRGSARRVSLEHGLHHSGTENYIRHVHLDRLLHDSHTVIRQPSLLRKMSNAFDSPPVDNADNKLHRFSFHHESRKRLIWDLILMLLLIADVVVTPLALSFGVDNPMVQFIDIINNFFYVFDVILRCLTSYTADKGAVLISDPRKTFKHYLSSSWVVFDLMSCFPWESIIQSRSIGRLMGIAKCVRLVQLPKLTRQSLPLGLTGILGIVELFGIVFMVSHFNACYWNLIALDWRQDTVNYDQQSVFWRYALCWSIAIGALNASPPIMHNPTEEITIALYMIMGNVLQATVFGSVAHLISSFNEREDAYHKKLMLTHDRCRFLGIPDSLSKRIQAYYRSLYRETKTVSADADDFINELSPALVCDVKYSLYRDMLKQIPFLASKRVDNSVVELLVMHLTTVIFMKDDVVTRKGERADWMGFIGIKGSVALLEYTKQQQHRVRRVLRKGDYFGETSVFQASTREHTVVALSWVQIHQLFRKDFESVKTNYPEQGSILEEEMSKYMTSKAAHKL